MLGDISEKELYARSAEQFIQELAHQAIVRDDSMMTREIGYWGFGTAPLLSESLFSDPFILISYNPLENFFATGGANITSSLLKRFNSATQRCYTALIDSGHVEHARVSFSKRFYESVFGRAYKFHQASEYDHDVSYEMWDVVRLAAHMANKLLASRDQQQYEALFVSSADGYRHDVLETLVEIVYEAMAGVSNEFKGVDDPFWHLCTEVTHDIFHSVGAEPDGMTPFQQRLGLKIIKKLNDNMNGFYPAICRVLLATVGPYHHEAAQPNWTAFNILNDAVYIALRRLPQLASTKPDKVADYLPPNVTYDATTKCLTHTFNDGAQRITDLAALRVPAFSLTSSRIRRELTDDERRTAESEYY
jgi:hypothetical protein